MRTPPSEKKCLYNPVQWTLSEGQMIVDVQLAVLRDQVMGRVPCLLSASAPSGVNVALRVMYTTGGALNTRTQVYDMFACLEDCVCCMFADHADINVYEHQYFNDTDEEETLTYVNGKPVLLDHMSVVGDHEMVGGQAMHVIELTMIRRCTKRCLL